MDRSYRVTAGSIQGPMSIKVSETSQSGEYRYTAGGKLE